mgnify:CR=1 FL=1
MTESDGTVTLVQQTADLEMEICTKDHFGSLAHEFENLELSQLYCIKKDQPGLEKVSIKGKFEVDEVSFLRIAFSACNNATSGGTCGTPEEIDQLLPREEV